MKMFPFLLISLFAVPALNNPPQVIVDDINYNVHEAEDDISLSHVRFHSFTIGGNDYLLPGANWVYETTPALDSDDATYFRFVVDAPSPDTYYVNYVTNGENYLLRNYVNNLTYHDDVGGVWDALTNRVVSYSLNEGKNVIVTQVNNWGGVKQINLDERLTLVRPDESNGVFYFYNHKNKISPLYFPGGNIFDTNARISVGPLDYDSDDGFLSTSTMVIKNDDDTASINLTYMTKGLSASSAPISISINSGAPFNFFLPASNNIYNTVNISYSTLLEAGYNFTPNQENTLIFKPVSSADKVVILDNLELSDDPSGEEALIDISISELKEKSYVMGREISSSDGIRVDWSASNMQVEFTGKGSVYAMVNTVGGAELVAEIDGEPSYVIAPNGASVIRLGSKLANGNHFLRLFKASEAHGSLCEITGLRVDENTTLSTYTPSFTHSFEFYGDSTCCANQISRDGKEDAYMSFSRILSDAYNATWNNVCVSGRGLYSGFNVEDNWAPSHSKQINTLYKYSSFFRDEEQLWDFSSYIPEVLVVDLGNNDLGKYIMETLDFTITDFTNEVERWHHEVRTLYPDTEIIYLYGLYENRDYENEYRAAINHLKDGGDQHVEFLYVPYLGSGKDSHPSYFEHELLARYLSEIISIKLGEEDPLGLTRRIEAEDATITGRYTTRTSTEEWERWSNGIYIGNTGPESPINSASEIKTDGSNVKLFSFDVNVEEAGRYAFRVAYSTSSNDSTIYYRLGNENAVSFKPIVLRSSDSWATPLEYSEPMYVTLSSGYNEFIMTGPSTNGSWANFDYIQYYKVKDDGNYYISTPLSSLFTFEDLPVSVLPGESVSFKVNLSENASQFADKMKVLVNDRVVEKDTEGYYHINNIQDHVHIEVTDIDRNTWTVTYMDGDKIVKVEKWRVDDNVSYSGLPNKNHYRFDGWDVNPPDKMPNHDIILHAVYVYDESVIVDETPWLLIIILASSSGVIAIGIAVTFLALHAKKKKALKSDNKTDEAKEDDSQGKSKKKKMKLWLKLTIIFGSIIATLLAAVGVTVLALSIARQSRINTDPEEVIPPESNTLVFARGTSLYDKDGKLLRLKGINAGNILVTEGWISPYSCGPLVDDKGNIVTDKDGNVEYPELTQEEFIEGFQSNPNLTNEQRKELLDIYYRNWFSDDDFRRVKEVFHMNAIRLPFYWRNILNYDENSDTYSRKSEEEAFGYLDYFMEKCLEYNLYCILDLHGAPKSQNGYEHSGKIEKYKRDTLWFDEKAIEATCDIWRFIAEHYKDSELGTAIATYDLLNEPCSDDSDVLQSTRHTNEDCYPVFNRIYQAIRETGDKHNITIEGVWTYANFIDPAVYGWENIQYECHFYNWNRDTLSYELYYDAMEATRIGHDYQVPYYIGEFTFFDNYDDWRTWLAYYDRLGYSWTFWTYKKTVVGWWEDSWGLYNYKLFLNNKTHEQKVDLRYASFSDIKSVFECSNSTNCYLSGTGKMIIDYLADLNH